MKLFGYEIKFKKKQVDDKVVIRSITPTSKPISSIPLVNISTLSYAQQFASYRGNFIGSEYDLSEVGRIEDVESFVRQSFKKKENLIFKEGTYLKGKNKDTIKYYTSRMAQIAKASGIPTSSLQKRLCSSLIRVSNAFLVKVRNEKASGGKIRKNPNGANLKPVAAYFPVAPETMRASINETTGRIDKWRQILPDGRYKDFNAKDVIHFVIDRREGFLFGIPSIIPAIDDIRALRQIEENIELLLYQHIFPLFHYKIGTEMAPAGYTEEGVKEIDAAREQIRLMPSEGALITPERHEIKAIGSEGRAIRAEGYLNHFKSRVYTGLGVSAVDLGEGDSTNKATAFTLSKALVDSIKAIQDEFESQWDNFVVTELLLESNFGDNVLEEENMVHLMFNEIDIRNKIELEQHLINLWKNQAITYPEFRSKLGYEPIEIPDDLQAFDLKKYPEWNTTYWKLFEEQATIFKSVDEPGTPAAKTAAKASSSNQSNPGAPDKSPRNRAPRLKKPVKDNLLLKDIDNLKEDLIFYLNNNITTSNSLNIDYLSSIIRTWITDSSKKFNCLLLLDFIDGFNEEVGNLSINTNNHYNCIKNHNKKILDKLIESIIKLLRRRIDQQFYNVKLNEARVDILNEFNAIFDLFSKRITSIWKTEKRRAYLFGKIMGIKFNNYKSIQLQAHPEACNKCKAVNNLIIPISNITFSDVPPYHPNSRINVRAYKKEDE